MSIRRSRPCEENRGTHEVRFDGFAILPQKDRAFRTRRSASAQRRGEPTLLPVALGTVGAAAADEIVKASTDHLLDPPAEKVSHRGIRPKNVVRGIDRQDRTSRGSQYLVGPTTVP